MENKPKLLPPSVTNPKELEAWARKELEKQKPTHSFPVSDWKSKGIRVGWHVRFSNGKIGIVTWINATDRTFMAKPIEEVTA